MCSRPVRALGLALLVTACFDTEQVDVTSRVAVDDFEDGDELASPASGFGPWWCDSFATGDATEQSHDCQRSAGFESQFGKSLTFSLHETASADYPGALLGVPPLAPTRDLRSFKTISFRAKFEPGEPAPPPKTRLLSELSCSSADAEVDDAPTDRSVVYLGETGYGVELPSGWASYSLPFAAFRQPFYQGRLAEEASCYGLVDAIRFRIDPQLTTDGQGAAGMLTIDDVYLE